MDDLNLSLNQMPVPTECANLPVWANYYNHTELSHTTTRPLEQPTLLDDLNLSLNPQPGWPSSTGLGRLRWVEAQVEAGWGKLMPSPFGWTLLDYLNSGLRQVEKWSSVRSWPSQQWTHHYIAIHDSTARLRPVEASLKGWISVIFCPSQWTHHCIAIYDSMWRQI